MFPSSSRSGGSGISTSSKKCASRALWIARLAGRDRHAQRFDRIGERRCVRWSRRDLTDAGFAEAGTEVARLHDRDLHPERGELERQALRQPLERVLARAVQPDERKADAAGRRGDLDQMPGARLAADAARRLARTTARRRSSSPSGRAPTLRCTPRSAHAARSRAVDGDGRRPDERDRLRHGGERPLSHGHVELERERAVRGTRRRDRRARRGRERLRRPCHRSRAPPPRTRARARATRP